jgi:GTP-binding protein
MDKSAVSYQIVLTKADQLKGPEQQSRISEVRELISKRVAAYPEVLMTSSETGFGIPELRGAILSLIRERGDKG